MKTYFIQRGKNGPIKIGKSKDPEARLKELQTASDEELHLLAVVSGDIEKQLHEHFKNFRIRGEWFEAEPALISLAIRYSRRVEDAARCVVNNFNDAKGLIDDLHFLETCSGSQDASLFHLSESIKHLESLL